uniref:RNase H type-1 domain-containing protein n=1 Tax=Nelumbo nucifera TaxID=4432 RepID=A0A822Y194_NELNU|nr:TPA_asm: hypothetical protein HUJ06_026523 [Nelumbo nucifera]
METKKAFIGYSHGDLNRNLLEILQSTTIGPQPPISPRPDCAYMLRFDNSLRRAFDSPLMAGIGGVIYNSKGVISWVFSGPVVAQDASEAEVQPLLVGLRAARALQVEPLLVEGESRITIE